MKWRFTAEEMDLIFLIAWPEQIPAFADLTTIYPTGVKNVLKWSIGLGLMTKKQKKQLTKQGLWGNEEFEYAVFVMLFFNKKLSIIHGDKFIKSYFISNNIVSSLTFLDDGNEYEVTSYPDRVLWKEDIIKEIGTWKKEQNTMIEFLGLDKDDNDISQSWDISRMDSETILTLLEK